MNRYESQVFFSNSRVSTSMPGLYLQVTTYWCGLPSLRAPPLCWDLFGESWKMQQDEFNLYSSNWTWHHHFVIDPLRFLPALVGLYTFIESTRSANSWVIAQQDFDSLKEWILVPLLSGGYSLIDFSFCRTWPARPRSFSAMLRAFVSDPTSGIHATNWTSSLKGCWNVIWCFNNLSKY